MINERFRELIQKPMTRRQFLQYIGLVVLSLLGINSIMSLIMDPKQHPRLKLGSQFGDGRFGV